MSLRLVAFFFIISASLHAEGIDADSRVFRKILENNAGIKTIDAVIEQVTIRGENTPEYSRGRFRADSRGRFRIDYHKPEKQLVVYNGRDLNWYYPENSLLYVYPGRGGENAPSYDPLSTYRDNLKKNLEIKYLGIRFTGLLNLTDLYRLEDRKSNMSIFLWIDTGRGLLLKRVVKDNSGFEYTNEEFSNYRKTGSYYFPGSVEVRVRTGNGIITSITRYTDVSLNKKFDSRLFNMVVPDGVTRKIINN